MPEIVRLTFDGRFYSVEALKKAAYRGVNAFTVDFEEGDTGHDCVLVPNSGVSDENFDRAIEEFRKDALDYELRAQIRSETESVRNLILGIAFSRTDLHGGE